MLALTVLCSGVMWRAMDLPGQLEFAPSNRMFLSNNRNIFVVCISLDKSQKKHDCEVILQRWLSALSALQQSEGDCCRVLVVGTRDDQSTTELQGWFDDSGKEMRAKFCPEFKSESEETKATAVRKRMEL